MMSKSDFPATDFRDFMEFAHSSNIIDNKYVTEQSVIVLFIAANYEVEDQDENPD